MKIKKLFLIAVLPMMCLAVSAQDNTPKQGDLTIAATLGYNSYTSVTAPSGLLQDYEVQALSTNWSDKKMMVGFEGGWFFNDLWKLNLGGGVSFTNNPGYSAVPGTYDGEMSGDGAEGSVGDIGDVPNYRAVANAQSFAYSAFMGVDRYYSCKVPNLMWYLGVRAGFAYAENEMKYDEETSMGKSVAETWNLRGALTLGVEYYILPGMFIGVQVDPFAYTYNMTTFIPQAGLGNLSADSYNYSLLAAPTIKIGFAF